VTPPAVKTDHKNNSVNVSEPEMGETVKKQEETQGKEESKK